MIFRLPTDADGFVRRECPSCRREFKTRPSRRDGAAMHRVFMAALCHVNEDEIAAKPPVRACPYCGHSAPGEAWIWSAFRKELSRLAATYAEHVRYQQMMHVPRTLAENPHPTFVPVEPRDLPPRLRGDPLGHFRRIELLCCGEVIKVRPSDSDRLTCTRCGTLQRTEAPPPEPTLPIPAGVQ